MRILLIEDDEQLSQLMKLQLEKEGYAVDICGNGEEALLFAIKESYDMIILDRMLPFIDGLTILTAIRKKGISVPVIVVTSMNGIGDRIEGLDMGADDYVIKPFDMEELKARIRALLRRPKALEDSESIRFSNIVLNINKQMLTSPDNSCALSKRESHLLEYFIRNKGRTLPREQILSHVWGPNSFVEDGNLDNYIHFLRRRLKAVQCQGIIKTIHGVGYRLEEQNDSKV